MQYFVVSLAVLSVAHAVYIQPTVAPAYSYPTGVPAVASHSQSVLRSLDGNSVISSYSKAVDTPHSSVRKYDSRVNNDAVIYAHVPTIPYHAPVYHKPTYYSNPAVYHYPAPSYYSHYPSYSAPTYTPPASLYHQTVYPAPSYVKPVAAPVHAPAVHYSDASAVSHLSFEGLGAHYTW